MSRKNRDSGAKSCKCDKCGLVCASAIAGKQHRRCSANPTDTSLKAKSEKLPTADRGRWI